MRPFITVTCINVHVHYIGQMQQTSAIKTCLDASVLNAMAVRVVVDHFTQNGSAFKMYT